ncbi:MAG: membrane protein insertase YidC [Elusimicrobiota bacterium]|jgi:YidC/Oxa1 family membrane protein insertase|nr:membrane protein insertase YidC [Elusimicrobiota bacterium]
MKKNTLMFISFSVLTILLWNFVLSPQTPKNAPQQPVQEQTQNTAAAQPQTQAPTQQTAALPSSSKNIAATNAAQEIVNIETDKYKISLTNKGAAVSKWLIKEQGDRWIDLILPQTPPVLANFDFNYKVISKNNEKVVFEYTSPDGWKITKTYSFSQDSYMHNIDIKTQKLNQNAVLPKIDLIWGPGLSTDDINMKENLSITRVGGFTAQKPRKYKTIKNEDRAASDFSWVAIDNRYFLAAFIPKNISDFSQIKSYREDKKQYYSLTLAGASNTQDISVDIYVGPKGYSYLQSYDIGLEESVDFGFFGFLGKGAFKVLNFFHNITNNYGWAIIILTICIQIIILPLTLKSYKSMSAMKRVQPMIKLIQDKYKNDKQRLQVEMMNIYKTQKVNPLGGCLPMLCQLPIFWAFFTMLRNAYELRGASWILWVNDLSVADSFIAINGFPIHLLPLIMGAGMFFQQRLTGVTSDPTQRKMMYILPIVFTFMFWSFPAGLVLYWLTNSIVSMIEQYIVIRRDSVKVKRV